MATRYGTASRDQKWGLESRYGVRAQNMRSEQIAGIAMVWLLMLAASLHGASLQGWDDWDGNVMWYCQLVTI